MHISKISEEAGGGEGWLGGEEAQPRLRCGGHAPEYQTASELFDLMTKNSNFDSNDDDSLTTRDLVLLYKNIDIGTKLMNDATGLKPKKPNQYVETVVYHDELESESDASDNYTPEDMQHVFTVNQERLNLFNDNSFENLLCHKFGGIEIKTSTLSTDYDKNFIFKDPFIKKQLINLNVLTNSSDFDGIFSTSLIDYICCKRLEDNYNFYMDNIIRYVQHTIEQLKRISNGDYLTDRAREKWREVNCNDQQENDTKVLATSTSIPLHVERKKAGNATWDDIVHSEMDVRSLSKILEKKIIVEIPKLLCGSYRLYSRRCSDNLIISCQKERQNIEQNAEENRLDVVLQLQRSQTGQVMSKISSIMILRTSSASPDSQAKEILPLAYKEENDEKCSTRKDSKSPTITVIELNKNTDPQVTEPDTECAVVKEISEQETEDYIESQNDGSFLETSDYPFSDRNISCDCPSILQSSDSSLAFRDSSDKPTFKINCNEKCYNIVSPDELRMSVQKLNMETSMLDENGEDFTSQTTSKRRSPVRVRIKSPYENKSFLMEEKKRKRLLEIRERREKKKMALNENCKITKHKYGKGAIMPQASNSVTKLSITNKSFYNSIYGQTFNAEDKPKTRKPQKNHGSLTPEVSSQIEETHEEYFESPMLTPEKNSKKYINRSYYLDEAETEMMYMKMKLESEGKDVQNVCSTSNSFVSNEFHVNFDLLKHIIVPSESNLSYNQTYHTDEKLQNITEMPCSPEDSLSVLPVKDTTVSVTASNETGIVSKKNSTSDECRKSIDQLYDLIKKFEKPNVLTDHEKEVSNVEVRYEVRGDCTIQGSESGTSVKHHATSSNHSGFSADKSHTLLTKSNKIQVPVVPKVIISSKSQSPKIEPEKLKKERRRPSVSSPFKGPPPDNPLKAISQLLHEFDNVQKTRQRPTHATRPTKKSEVVPNDVKIPPQQAPGRRRSRFEQHFKDYEQEKKPSSVHYPTPKEKNRVGPRTGMEQARNSQQQNFVEDKNLDKITKKKIADIIDEAKEARGEAVRGPSKLNSRLNSLAQPKKSYVLAHHEEYQSRYGRNMLADRLQKLAGVPTPGSERNTMYPNPRNKWRRSGAEVTPATVKQPVSSSPHLDKTAKGQRCSASSSPDNGLRQPSAENNHRRIPETPNAIKKMVAVESYVQSHYGRTSSQSGELLSGGNRSRAPLVPTDLELESMGSSPACEARELGDSLHRLIDVMVSAAPAGGALASLPSLPEGAESPPAPATSRGDSAADPSHVNTAFYSGAFQNRHRIKNLTPKHSTQQVFLLQSGDAGSVVVKSTVSSLKVNLRAESLHDLKAMPVLSSTHLDWNFTQIPSQIVTLGYVFPEHQVVLNKSNSKVKIMGVSCTTDCSDSINVRVSNRCFEGSRRQTAIDSGAQTDLMATETVAASTPVACLTRPVINSSVLVEIKQTEMLSTAHINSLETLHEIEYSDNRVIDNRVIDHKLTDDRATNDRATNGGAPNDRATNDRATNGGATNDRATNDRATNGGATNDRTTNDRATNGGATNDRATNDRATNGGATNNRATNGGATNDRATNGGATNDTATNGGATNDRATNDRATNDRATNDTATNDRITGDKITNNKVTDNRIIDYRDTKLAVEEVIKNDDGFKDEVKGTSENSNSAPNPDYTTSLDMLVGLLNEIQKITHLNQIAADSNNQNCAAFENVLDDAALKETDKMTSCDLISITSLGHMRKLESTTSNSINLSVDTSDSNVEPIPRYERKATECIDESTDTGMSNSLDVNQRWVDENIATDANKTAGVDKEVNVNVCENSTGVPSSLLPAKASHNNSAYLSNCAVSVISKPSNQSIISLVEYQTLYSNTLFNAPSVKKIIELPQIEAKNQRVLIPRDKTDLNEKCFAASFKSIQNVEQNIKKEGSLARSAIRKYCVKGIDLDPMFKIKRDILVTVYSILVLTVFAALSFPELMMLL